MIRCEPRIMNNLAISSVAKRAEGGHARTMGTQRTGLAAVWGLGRREARLRSLRL
jgi:hypothetical protein